jgi:hypothetical protein
MSNVVDFPGADREVSEGEVNDLHAEAFRDLEGRISDGAIMAHIAVGLAEPFINNRDDRAEQALFAVCHIYEMLKKLNRPLFTASSGVRREAPAPNGQKA